jgi:acyl carrier protein
VLTAARDIFAEAVGYPPEAFTPESDLESDLGIDSIKQIAVFGKILEYYGLTMPDPPPRLTGYPTFSAFAKLITEIHDGQSA